MQKQPPVTPDKQRRTVHLASISSTAAAKLSSDSALEQIPDLTEDSSEPSGPPPEEATPEAAAAAVVAWHGMVCTESNDDSHQPWDGMHGSNDDRQSPPTSTTAPPLD